MGKTIVMYRWRYYCEIRRKTISTKRALPEELIKVEHPDAVPIESTRVEISVPDDPMNDCTSAFLRGVDIRGG